MHTFIDRILHVHRITLVGYAYAEPKNGILEQFKQLDVCLDVLVVEESIDSCNV